MRDSALLQGNGLRRDEIRHARVLAILPRAAATDFSAVLVPVISIMASGIARGRERTTRIARVVRTRPSGSTTAARSAETPRLARSDTPRTTAARSPRLAAHSRIGADSMSPARAPGSDHRPALWSGG